jgi:tetratricopeptide (TPR) repeat protein
MPAIRTISAFLLMMFASAMPAVVHAQTGTPSASPALPPGTNAQVDALLQQSSRLESTGKPAEADAGYRAAIAAAEKLTDPREKAELARALIWQAHFLSKQKRYDEAWAVGERALHRYEQVVGPQDPRTAKAHVMLGTFAYGTRDFQKAEAHLRIALDEYDRDPAEGRRVEAGTAALTLAFALRGQKRFADAERALIKAIEIREKTVPRDHAGIAGAYQSLAGNSIDQGRAMDAAAAHEAAVKAAENLRGPQAAVLATVLLNQAAFLRSQRQYSEARLIAERALSLRESLLGKDHPAVVRAHLEVGTIALAQGDRVAADMQLLSPSSTGERRGGGDGRLSAGRVSEAG